MIKRFRDRDTELIFNREVVLRFRQIERVALRKLRQIDSAARLTDLALPGNCLEALKGDRLGQHGIRINDKYRICFVWRGSDAFEVEIVDYH